MKLFNTNKTTNKVVADEYPFEQPDKQKIQYFSRSWENIRHEELRKLLENINKKLDLLIELERQKEDK